MPNTKILKDQGQEFYPITHVSCVVGMENNGRMNATYAWDGTGTPDVSKIPSGVVVTYNGTSYTGTLAASASTTGMFYLVPSTTVTGEWDRYITEVSGSSFAWKAAGNTAIPSPTIADNLTTDDATQALSAAQGVVLDGKVSQLEAKVDELVQSESESDADFFIADDNGKAIVKFSGGHIATKNFDSSKTVKEIALVGNVLKITI